MALYRLVDPGDLASPTMVVALDGWVDAGSAATAAAEQIKGDGAVLATFDADRLFDYRSRRPVLQIVDGRPSELTWPELTLTRNRIDGRDLLVLTGAEPDFRWHELAEAAVELAARLGVAEWLSLGAIPAVVPHTRPVPVLGTASRPGLLRGDVRAGPEGLLRVPAAAISVLDFAVTQAGVPAVGYFAQVPHYLSGPYPAAAVELLRIVGRHLGIEIPPGGLAREARALGARLDAATAADEATRSHVEKLEALADEEALPSGNELIADIERFLREGGSHRNS